MTKKSAIFFILFFMLSCALSLYAQRNTYLVSGQVISSTTKLPLSRVNVQIDGTTQSTLTNDDGFFELQGKSDSLLLVFQYIGYEKKYLYITAANRLNLLVALDPKDIKLNEVTIRASPLDTVFISQRSHVLDYDFYGTNILLITFGNTLTKAKLVLLNPLFDTLQVLSIPEKPERLFKDCLGNNHLICATHVYLIYDNSTSLQLLQPVERTEFENVTIPCIASDSANLYFMQKSGAKEIKMNYFDVETHNHVVGYFSFNRVTKKQSPLLTIADEKTLAMKAEEERFSSQKNAAGAYRSEVAKEADRLYAENAIYKEVFAPLQLIRDTIYVFDFINSRIACYSSTGTILKQVEITFHQTATWRHEIYFDEVQQKVYASFRRDGITELKEINLQTGLLGEAIRIPFPYVGKISVHDGYVYFLYLDKDYAATKYVSRIRITS